MGKSLLNTRQDPSACAQGAEDQGHLVPGAPEPRANPEESASLTPRRPPTWGVPDG